MCIELLVLIFGRSSDYEPKVFPGASKGLSENYFFSLFICIHILLAWLKGSF